MNSASPLVMIHGLLGSINYFAPADHLDGITVHTPDLQGYGTNRQAAAQAVTLEGQALHVADHLRKHVDGPAWLLGHSVGGVVAMLVASQAPDLVRGLISVEGNFTLNDAFWCSKVAPMSLVDWQTEYQRMCSDETAWLLASGIASTPERALWARRILDNQPAATVQAMARAVVAATGRPDYLARVKDVVDAGTPVCLLAGENSRAGWDVPAWVTAAARRNIVLDGVGHMMMLESPQAFCRAVRDIVQD